MTETYSLPILDGKSLQSRCVCRARFYPKALGRILASSSFCCPHHSCLCLNPHMAFSSVFMFQISVFHVHKHLYLDVKPPLNPGWALLEILDYTCQDLTILVFPDSSVGKESACNAGDPGSIPGLGRSAGEGIGYPLQYSWASLVAQLVKNPPAMRDTWVQSLGGEDPLEKGKATCCSIPAWRIPWTV